jgi:fumarate reductase iron-sulfur subunit
MSVVTLRVFRWAPGEPEGIRDYRVAAGASTTVLDGLVDAQRQQDPSLAFRYACRVGMCGSCAMVINGRERWACRTLVRSLGGDVIRIRPLYHFPLIRDLVVDMGPFVEKMRRVGAVLLPGPPGGESTRLPGDAPERREIDQAIECIGCGMCVSACTVVAHNARFPGPAALNRAFTLQRDHRDHGQDARWAVLLTDDALARCHGQGTCTEVCPMELAPSASIIRLRQRAVRRLCGLGP